MYVILWFLPITILAFIGYFYLTYKKIRNEERERRKTALRNKVVVITGASSGIGEAIAHVFYEEGCRVVLAARRLHELMRVRNDLMSKQLPEESPEPIVFQLDISQPEECKLFAKRVETACDHVDILINNAGISHRGANFNTTLKIHKLILDVNYFGTISITNAILPKMMERKSGLIAIMGSPLSRMTLPYRGPYCASKHALLAYADSLRTEIHPYNIRVSIILPGFVKTDISAKALDGVTGKEKGKIDDEVKDGLSPESVAERLLAMVIDQEDEVFFCQPLVKFALFLRHYLPSVYFHFMNKRRQ